MLSSMGRKLLFSNLSYQTTEDKLMAYFSNYGSIEDLCLFRDDQDQSLRQGFLVYSNQHSVDHVMSKRPHQLQNRTIHLQRDIPNQCINSNNPSESLGSHLTVTELFINRLYPGDTRETFLRYFQHYGAILDCRVYHSSSFNGKQTGYAFLRFADYDSVDRIILSRPHRIDSKIYHLRKSIPREYNYIISSTKPISQNKPVWRHFAMGLINLKTQEILYPNKSSPRSQPPMISTNKCLTNPRAITVSVDTNSKKKNSLTNEFEILPAHSPSSDSISIVNSIDSFTPLASPLYSTAIAYSPTIEIISKPNANSSYLLTMIDPQDKQIYEMI